MGEAGTLFGLIHDLKDRTEQRKIRDAQRNFLTDPEASIAATNLIDPNTAFHMNEIHQKDLEDDQAKADARAAKYKTAAASMASGLYRIQQGGGDVGQAFDQMAPVMQNAFGMKPEEVAQWRQQVTSNPDFVKNLHQYMASPDDAKMSILAPGSIGTDPITGEVRVRNPGQAHVVHMKDGKGGDHLFMVDENGNLIGGDQAEGPSAPGTPGAAAAYTGPRTIDPNARGMRNGNPGNIKDSPWARRQPGYTGSDGTFAQFATPDHGAAAQERLLSTNYVNGQRNVSQIVDKYLGFPAAKENSPEQRNGYIAYVAGRLGLDPSQPVPPTMVKPLASAMREFESGGGGPSSGNGPHPIVSTEGKTPEDKGWRNMTPDEKKQSGVDVSRAYQVGIGGVNDGLIREVPGQVSPNGAKTGKGAQPQTAQSVYDAERSLQKGIETINTVLNSPSFEQATGSIQGMLPSILPGSVEFDRNLKALQGKVVVDALINMKKASPNGATGFGQLSKTEGEWLKYSQGAFDPRAPDTLRKNANELRRDMQVSIGSLHNVPPAATMFLLQRPETAAQFDQKFGAGMAKKILGK